MLNALWTKIFSLLIRNKYFIYFIKLKRRFTVSSMPIEFSLVIQLTYRSLYLARLLYLSCPQKDIFIPIYYSSIPQHVCSFAYRSLSISLHYRRSIHSISFSIITSDILVPSWDRASHSRKNKYVYCQLQIDFMLKLFSNEEETSVFTYFLPSLRLPPLHWHFRLIVAATTGRFISPVVCLLCFLSLHQ